MPRRSKVELQGLVDKICYMYINKGMRQQDIANDLTKQGFQVSKGAVNWTIKSHTKTLKDLFIHMDLHDWAYDDKKTTTNLLKKFQMFDSFIIKYGELTPYNDFSKLPPIENMGLNIRHIVLKTND